MIGSPQRRFPVGPGAVLGVVVIALAACSDSGPTEVPLVGALSEIPTTPSPNFGQADQEYFEVCKQYVGATGPQVQVEVTVVRGDGQPQSAFVVRLDDGDCTDVWLHGAAPGDVVTVVEVPVPGFTTTYTQTTKISGVSTTVGPVVGNRASGFVVGIQGELVVFTNTFVPPPGGGEGCTPGYWKQAHHFDSWVGVNPGDAFGSAGFTDIFPGKTLVQVLSQGGGHEKALGRHAVAALLNALSSVDYDLSAAQVVAAFNAAVAGGDVEGTKNIFANFNEQGCPLN